jgi:dTDP-4-amino-4,6-dideoxygalactose transaminase
MRAMTVSDFALFGAPPTFPRPLPIGQRYFPSPERYEQAFLGIFGRQYYTEYGPLNQRLERELQDFLGVRHAICVTNESIALMMTADAVGATGKVIVVGAAAATSAPLSWAGLRPVACDIDRDTLQIDPGKVNELIDEDTSAIIATHLWAGACDVSALRDIADRNGIPLIFDASGSFGCACGDARIGGFGRAEVFSFHQDNVLNATEGGCICTDDDELADCLRTMRGSAGASTSASVAKTVNGRMSEAQAALALIGLEDFPARRANNENLHNTYRAGLTSVPGIDVLEPHGVTMSNFQCAICRIVESEYGLSRDALVQLLTAENIGARPLPHADQRSPNGLELSRSCIELPIGQHVTLDGVRRICSILGSAHHSAVAIRASIDPTSVTRVDLPHGAVS